MATMGRLMAFSQTVMLEEDKKRNIRDNIFVLNAITNLASKENRKSCDIATYDIEKCFDAMWAQETINDMWDAGCRDNKLSLLHMENQSAQVVVKSAAGK